MKLIQNDRNAIALLQMDNKQLKELLKQLKKIDDKKGVVVVMSNNTQITAYNYTGTIRNHNH